MSERCKKVIDCDSIGHPYYEQLSTNKDYSCKHFKKSFVTKTRELFGFKSDKQYCMDCKFYYVETFRHVG